MTIKNAKIKPIEITQLEQFYDITLEEEEALPKKNSVNYDLHQCSYNLNGNSRVIRINLAECGIEDLSPISSLTDLVYLNLTENKIEDITPLSNITNLKELLLGGNHIRNIDPISSLTHLERLTLWNNPIANMNSLSHLIYLKELYCQSTGTKDLNFLKNLNSLKVIAFDYNKISDITILKVLPRLNAASFNRNKIVDVSFLSDLNNNLNVDISGNSIKLVPLKVAEKFNWLNCERPYFFRKRSFNKNGQQIDVSNNPITYPPNSVIELGTSSVKNYYSSSEEFGNAHLSEGRIIFIGDGSSGKTSIIEKLLFDTFSLGREQTNGIKIEQLQLEHPEDKRLVNFNIWDFGGQEIQHAVHKFFFTEGCLYLLVLDNRKEEEPEYWLQQIESLGGGAPVLVVFNKQDENLAETVDRKYLKEKYPNILGFYNTSCKNGFGISDLKADLEKEVIKLRTVDEQFPRNWLNIKKSIQEQTTGSNNYLKFKAFKEICIDNKTYEESSQNLLLKYLNTIGSVTWFGEDTHLKFFHVLNPAWITQGVYKILTCSKTAKSFGRIEVRDFKEILEPTCTEDFKYNEENYVYLLSMMKKFELCDSSNDRHLLIPSAFGKVPKVEYSEFKGEDVRIYILSFKDYMPLACVIFPKNSYRNKCSIL